MVEWSVRGWLLVVLISACGDEPRSPRELRVIDTLVADNAAYTAREPWLVALKLKKMQRSSYEWMRGSSGLYWRDVIDGDPRLATAFTAPSVLVVGDPHPENLGTFRAADGTMLVDWNDLDAAGYGPFVADLRRLAVGMVLATHGDGDDAVLVSRIVEGYTAQITGLASGGAPIALGRGLHPLFDEELDDAEDLGDEAVAVTELAGPTRVLRVGDLDPVAGDGVYEDTVFEVSADEAARIDAAVAQWAARRGEPAAVKLRARRVGAGVSSYPALRYNVLLDGPTTGPADDFVIELKEERDGVFLAGAIDQHAPAWSSPAARVADAQLRAHARADADALLGFADLGGLSLKVRDRAPYQRGLSHTAIDALGKKDLLALGTLLGGRLASSHGASLNSQGVMGWTVIAPVIAGRQQELTDEVIATALAEAAQEAADHDAFEHDDLSPLVIPSADQGRP